MLAPARLVALASTLAATGDLDGDGHDDFAGAWEGPGFPPPLGVDVFSGRDGNRIYSFADANRVDELGRFDADGLGDVLAGEGGFGLSENDYSLSAHFCPPGQLGIFLYGDTPAELPFGDGLRCVGSGGSGVHRLPPAIRVGDDGVATRALDFESAPMNAGPGEVRAAHPWYFQFWYRDPAGPGGSGFNLSDALEIVFCP